MKTINFRYVIYHISMVLLVFVFSCNKGENNLPDPPANKPYAKSLQATDLLNWVPVKDSVYKMIKRMRHWDSAYRENRFPGNLSLIPAEHAIWMLQSNANFDYAKFNDSLLADVSHEFTVDLSIEDQSGDSLFIRPIDLATAYSIIEDTLIANQQRQEYIQMIIFNIGEITSTKIEVIAQIITASWHGHIPILPANTSPSLFTQGYFQTLRPPYGLTLTQPYLPLEIEKRINPVTLLGSQLYAKPQEFFYLPKSQPEHSIPCWVPWPGSINTGYDLGVIWGGNTTEYINYNLANQILIDGAWFYANYHRYASTGNVLWKYGCMATPTPDFITAYEYSHLYMCFYARLVPFNNTL